MRIDTETKQWISEYTKEQVDLMRVLLLENTSDEEIVKEFYEVHTGCILPPNEFEMYYVEEGKNQS